MKVQRPHIHRFAIREPARQGVVWHWRGFLTVRRHADDDRKLFGGRLEVIVRRLKPELSARFHVGTRGSETPYDGHLIIVGSGVYWGLENGGKLAHCLSRCANPRHKWEGRDLSARIFGGKAYLNVWTHDGSWERGEFAPWRYKSFTVSPLDLLLGPRRRWFESQDRAQFTIDLPDGSYPVVATLRKVLIGRTKSRKREQSWEVDVDAPRGIPYRVDLSGWKGDRVYGFGVPLPTLRDDWQADAKAAITAYVLKHRARSGFRRPEPQED